MKNIKETLEEHKVQVEGRFKQLDQKRLALVKEQQQITAELMRLQGEHRKLLQLLEDFKDEPKGGG